MKSAAFPTRIVIGIVEEFGKTEVICFCKQENFIIVSIWDVLKISQEFQTKKGRWPQNSSSKILQEFQSKIKIPDSSLEKQLTSPKFYDISSLRTISIFHFYLGFCWGHPESFVCLKNCVLRPRFYAFTRGCQCFWLEIELWRNCFDVAWRLYYSIRFSGRYQGGLWKKSRVGQSSLGRFLQKRHSWSPIFMAKGL